MYPLVPNTSSLEIYPRYVERIFETFPLFISDALVYKSLISASEQQTVFCTSQSGDESGPLVTSETELHDSLRLVELLQQSAVEHLTTYRQLTAQQYACGVTMVTTDFEALYAFKHGNFQLCLQLCRKNVRTLLHDAPMDCFVRTFPVFIQLFDDDIVSLIALIMIVNRKLTSNLFKILISQLTLSLYLMTQCQLKLRHSLTSLAETLDYIEVAQRIIQVCQTLDQFTLKLASRKITTRLTMKN